MNNQIDIDKKWLTEPTGDPFADVGGLVIKNFQEKFPNKNIKELIEEVTKIYVDKWNNGLSSFFLNSTITQPAFKNKEKQKTSEYFESLLFNKIPFIKGTCRIIGKRSKLFRAGRDNSILVGSGGFINFNHNFEDGLYYSKEILIRLFFIPFGLIQLSGKIALIYSNNFDLTSLFVKNNFNENIRRLANLSSSGVLQSEFRNPANSVFKFIDDCLTKQQIYSSLSINDNLNLHHFTNYGDKHDIFIYELKSMVFLFYRTIIKRNKEDWQNFINGNYEKYKNHKSSYDFDRNMYIETVNEYKLISIKDYKKLKKESNLSFNLTTFGKEENSESEFFIIDKNEFDYWKTSKSYRTWKEEQVKGFKINTKNIKSTKTLVHSQKDFKVKWDNKIYEKLLNNKSILSDILRWSKKRKFNFRIVEYYQIYVRNMEKQTIEKIKELADFIVNQKESDAVKKSISRLNGCKNSHDVRLFLLKLIDKNYQVNNEKPLITLDEYVNYLFPDGINWREIRDLLLIAIYQLLHEKNLELEIEELDNELNEDQQ